MKVKLGTIITIANLFVWYYHASTVLRGVIDRILLNQVEKLILNVVFFSVIIVSMTGGAYISGKLVHLKRFILLWNLFGVFSSLALAMLEMIPVTTFNILFLLSLVGISFGLGFPSCMRIFADITEERNRAWFGSILILFMFMGLFVSGFITSMNSFWNVLVLTAFRSLGLISFRFLNDYFLNYKQKREVSFVFLLVKERAVLLYLAPWSAFSIVNYLGWPICSKIYGEEFVHHSALVSSIITIFFALISGFFADNVGRRKVLITGFIIFGIAYAMLGINPYNFYVWYFYTIADGVAWGIFYVVFWFTIWGDLAHEQPSEKYYVIGIIPYIFSGFLRVTIGPFIINAISEYAIFSFAAFFLFLAVIPLMFAPETLPEKTLRERELRSYIERAKRVREKFTRG
ncbi:MAG: hypothetical protein QXD34_02820 [Candidatus Bathyarchaeia archaeon]|nr:hypothetical protein [Candidatus Bathyarchaeota archaeon]